MLDLHDRVRGVMRAEARGERAEARGEQAVEDGERVGNQGVGDGVVDDVGRFLL